MSFNIMSVVNPPSTTPTSLFSTQIYDQYGYLVNDNNPLIGTFLVQMQYPAAFLSITVQNQPRKAFELTTVSFTFTASMQLPVNTQMIITYPQQLGFNESYQGCLVSNKDSATQCEFDNETLSVNITQVNSQVVIDAGTVVQVTLYGLVNSLKAAPTDSFTIKVLTADGYYILS